MTKHRMIKHAGLAAAVLLSAVLPAAAAVSSPTHPGTLPQYRWTYDYYNNTGPLVTPDGRVTAAGAAYERATNHEKLCEKDSRARGC